MREPVQQDREHLGVAEDCGLHFRFAGARWPMRQRLLDPRVGCVKPLQQFFV